MPVYTMCSPAFLYMSGPGELMCFRLPCMVEQTTPSHAREHLRSGPDLPTLSPWPPTRKTLFKFALPHAFEFTTSKNHYYLSSCAAMSVIQQHGHPPRRFDLRTYPALGPAEAASLLAPDAESWRNLIRFAPHSVAVHDILQWRRDTRCLASRRGYRPTAGSMLAAVLLSGSVAALPGCGES